MQLKFGERNIVEFSSPESFYEALGFLANGEKRGIRFDFEKYDNKWGIEGRIWITKAANAPKDLRASFSAGTQQVDSRLNCNEYIRYLINNYGFEKGSDNTYRSIVAYIPSKYVKDFDRGYKL